MLIFQEDRQFLWFFYTIYSISCSLFFAKVVVITIFLFLSPYSGIVIPDGDWQNKLKKYGIFRGGAVYRKIYMDKIEL